MDDKAMSPIQSIMERCHQNMIEIQNNPLKKAELEAQMAQHNRMLAEYQKPVRTPVKPPKRFRSTESGEDIIL